MRKKLLRSRTGFEKPESREEAIMQNILGASNVLEPAESNIEEILKSILYNTPYTKEAEFEIEKILLAIKNNGTYDGKGESRDMKILIAILKDLDYTEEAESRIEELFIEWLHQRSSIKVLEGVPPLTFTSRGLPLINYLIEGNTVQSGTPTPTNPIYPTECGDKTANLLDKNNIIKNYWLSSINGNAAPQTGYFVSDYIKVSAEEIYNLVDIGRTFCWYDENKTFIRTDSSVTQMSAPVNAKFLRANGSLSLLNSAMIYIGTTDIPYEPYGYKIPISSANTTTPVYLGEAQTTRKIKKLVLTGEEKWYVEGSDVFYTNPITEAARHELICSHFRGIYFFTGNNQIIISQSLRIKIKTNSITHTVSDFKTYLAQQYAAGTPVTVWYVLATETTGIVNEPLMKIGDYADTVSKEQAGVEIPTASGSNTLDVDTTVKPSNIYIEYK